MNRFRHLPAYHYEDNADGILKKSVGKPLRNYKLYGESIQEGENLFNISDIGSIYVTESATRYGIQFDNLSGTYKFSCVGSGGDIYYKILKDGVYGSPIKTGTEITINIEQGTSLLIYATGMSVFNQYSDYKLMKIQSPDTPIEIESVGDKTQNILPYPYYQSSQTVAGVTYTVGDDGGITISGISTKQTSFFLSYDLPKPKSGYLTMFCKYENISNILMGVYQYDVSGTYLTHRDVGPQYTPASMEILDDTEKIRVVIKPRAANVECSGIIYPMILDGNYTEGLQYEPYGYRIPVIIRSKNLANFPDFTLSSNPQNINPSEISSVLRKLGTFTFSTHIDNTEGTSTSKVRLSLFMNGAWKYLYTSNIYAGEKGWSKLTFTVDNTFSGSFNFQFSGTSGKTKFLNIMLEYGNTATEYEPYYEPITTNIYLNQPLRKIGDYADYIDFQNNVVNIKTKSRILDSNEPCWINSAYDKQEGYSCFYFMINGDSTQYVTSIVESNYLPFIEWGYTLPNSGESISIASNGRNVMLVVKNEIATTAEEFKAWLQSLSDNGTPFRIWYYLKPDFQTTKTIELPSLPTHKGTNIIEIDTTIQPSAVQYQYYKGGK